MPLLRLLIVWATGARLALLTLSTRLAWLLGAAAGWVRIQVVRR